MADSLAVKWRPREWEDVCGQKSIIKILSRQVELDEIKNSYLFCGASGCGKTTLARIFANKINGYVGEPIEIDAASNNGVDNVKNIIKAAQERSIDSKYKIYIIDECHSLTNQAWQAFLKCIEEPPTYTIFIFCTTDPQKIPATILNRVQRFNISRISLPQIINRLKYICEREGYTNYEEATEYIAKISDGGMRDAICTLEKCVSYSTDLNITNVLESLGNYSYEMFFDIINGMIDGKEKVVLHCIEELYSSGSDLKLFVDNFLSFCLDISKYNTFRDINMTKIPSTLIDKLNNSINFDNASGYYMYLMHRLLNLKQMIKNDSNIKDTITVVFLQLTRCQ